MGLYGERKVFDELHIPYTWLGACKDETRLPLIKIFIQMSYVNVRTFVRVVGAPIPT
jgi:hypothetical protein